jgi:hypothetical protein
MTYEISGIKFISRVKITCIQAYLANPFLKTMDLIKNGESSKTLWRSIDSDSDQMMQQEALGM